MQATSTTKATLLLRLKLDTPEREVAWREFHASYAPIITEFARRMGVERHAIEDIVQDVLLGFFSATPEFQYDPSIGRFRGYLKTCTWRKFQKRLGMDAYLGGKPIRELAHDDAPVEAVWEDIWETQKLHQAMEIVRQHYAQSPEMQKTFDAFEMNVVLERPAEEVAGELQMKPEGVYQAKARITKALKEAMAQLQAFAD
jgi:RNA polymerase sigma factor (sigma-70 family)